MAERAGRAGSRGIGPRPPQGEAPQGHRNPNPCPHYRKCGGCQLQNMTYPQQLIWKQRQVERLLGQYAPVQQILGMEHPYHYRNKVQAAFAYDRKRRRIISGVYQSSTHLLVPLDSCPIEDRTADAIIVTVRELLKAFGLTAYDELSGRGLLRHVLVKRGFSSGQVMVVLVTATPVFPSRNRFVEALCQRHPEITTVLQNVNPQFTSLVLGEREKVLYGPGFIEDTLCGLTFQISAKSFYQINPVQTEVLYGKAMEYAALTGRERVIDAYCGIGTIGLVAAKRAGQVLGVENNREAVGDAIQNARRNNIQNARFLCADAGEFCQELAQADNLKIGDKLSFNDYHDKENSPAAEAEIIGIYQVSQKMSPLMQGDTYRSENVIFTDLYFPQKAEGETSPLFQRAYFKVGNINDYDTVKERIKEADIDWQQYDLIDNNGNSETMSSNFNDLDKISETMIAVISAAGFFILIFVFLFWIKNRVHEIGVFLSLGISRPAIIGQIWTEAVMTAFLSVLLSFAIAPAVSRTAADYLVARQVQQAEEKAENDSGKAATEYTAPQQNVQKVNVTITPAMYLADGAGVLLLITSSVMISGISVLKRNPKDILSEMS